MATSRSSGRGVPKPRGNESLSLVSTIADLREQTLLVVALLDQADKALEERNAATFCEFFCKGHEAARSARERARALHDQVCSHTRRNVTRGGAR